MMYAFISTIKMVAHISLMGRKQTGLNLLIKSLMVSKIPMVDISHRKRTLFLFSNQKLATQLLILL